MTLFEYPTECGTYEDLKRHEPGVLVSAAPGRSSVGGVTGVGRLGKKSSI